eukprot:1160029-Pelagomonas_calceolata.AAC.7
MQQWVGDTEEIADVLLCDASALQWGSVFGWECVAMRECVWVGVRCNGGVCWGGSALQWGEYSASGVLCNGSVLGWEYACDCNSSLFPAVQKAGVLPSTLSFTCCKSVMGFLVAA